ncbi:MAG: lysylphosphatidylglycerol synthase transmembrane domain-containing protein [bacterium]
MNNSETRRVPPWIWHVLRLAGIPFVIYVIMKVDWNEVLLMYRRLGLATTLAMVAALFVVLLVKVRRWFDLLRYQGVPRSGWEVFLSYTEAYFHGFITPARLGEVYRLRHLTQWGLDTKRAAGNLIVERGMDVAFLASLGLFSLGLYSTYPHWIGAVYGLIVVLLASSGGLLVLRRFPSLRSWIARTDGSHGSRLLIITCLGLTIASWAIMFAIVYVVRGFLGIDMGPVMTLFSFVLSTAIVAIPVSVAGFGTKELALIHFLGVWGYEPEQAVAFSLIFAVIYVLNLLFSGLIWFAILAHQHVQRPE